jgi:hypothetical protein
MKVKGTTGLFSLYEISPTRRQQESLGELDSPSNGGMAVHIQPDHSEKIFIPSKVEKEPHLTDGLEVVQPQWEQEKHVKDSLEFGKTSPIPSPRTRQGQQSNRKLIIIGTLVSIIVIAGAVVGGVVGGKSAFGSSGDANSSR